MHPKEPMEFINRILAATTGLSSLTLIGGVAAPKLAAHVAPSNDPRHTNSMSSVRLPACLLSAALLTLTAQAPSPLRSFNRFVPLPDSGDHSAALSIGDVNGDGHPDLVLSTGRHWESPIHLYLGNGTGAFQPAGDIGSGGYASYGVPLIDLNGDGILDLAVGTDAGGPKPIFFGDGKGRFNPAGSFGESTMPSRNIAVGDLNGDGSPDIAIANRGRQSYVYLNDGHGAFPRGIAYGGPRDSNVTVAIADMDHDGHADLVIARRDGQQSVVLLNDGHSAFLAARPFGPPDADTRALAVGDLNGDGFPDIVACHLGLGTFLYLNDGHGNFRQSTKIAGAEDGFYSLAIVDMNRDGKRDLVGGNTARPNAVFFNLSDGSAFQRVEFGEGGPELATYGLAIADLNGDGFPDIAVARSGAPSGIFFSTPPGARKPAEPTAAPAPAPATFSITIQPATGPLPARRPLPGTIDIRAADLRTIVAEAWNVEPYRVTGDALKADPTPYNVLLLPGKADRATAIAALQQAVSATFHIAVARESRPAQALVLKPPTAAHPAIAAHTGGPTGTNLVTRAGVTLRNDTLAEFAGLLQEAYNRPVIDETKLAGKYDLKFNWEGLTAESLANELQRQLGIPTAIETRPIEMLVVTKR